MRIALDFAHAQAMITWYIVQISTICPFLATTVSPLVLYIYRFLINKLISTNRTFSSIFWFCEIFFLIYTFQTSIDFDFSTEYRKAFLKQFSQIKYALGITNTIPIPSNNNVKLVVSRRELSNRNRGNSSFFWEIRSNENCLDICLFVIITSEINSSDCERF